MKLVETHLISI